MQLQVNAVSKLINMTAEYYENMPVQLVRIIYEKKLLRVFSIHTKMEMEELLRPSVPEYNGNKFIIRSKYHLFEEELFFWSTVSRMAPIRHIGVERCMEVFRKVFPHQAHKLNL